MDSTEFTHGHTSNGTFRPKQTEITGLKHASANARPAPSGPSPAPSRPACTRLTETTMVPGAFDLNVRSACAKKHHFHLSDLGQCEMSPSLLARKWMYSGHPLGIYPERSNHKGFSEWGCRNFNERSGGKSPSPPSTWIASTSP